MATDIYKAVPALNTLNVNLNDFAPDNLSLEMYKGLLKIGEEFDNTKQTAIFNQTIANLDRADQEYKNTFLSNKDVDFQNGEFRGKALAGLNDTVEYKKKLILDTKGLDGAMKQKLYNHLSEKSGTIALGVHSDVLTFETKENIDTSLKMKGDGVELLKMSPIESDRGTYYKMIFDSVDRLSFFGENTSKLMTDTVKEITDAEAWGQGVFLQDKLFGKNLRYENILSEFESWKKTIISDEYLEKKSNEITASFVGKDSDKEKYKNAIKSNLKADYEKMIMEKTPYVMQQYETQKERELNQQRFLMQYELDKENLAYQKEKDVKDLVRGYVDSGDLIGAISAAKGIPVTPANLLTSSTGLFKLGTNMDMSTAVARNKTADIISNEKLKFLETGKQNSYDTGQGIGGFIKGYIQNEVDSIPSKDGKILYSRNLSHRGLVPYGLMEMYINNNPEYGKATNLMTFVETQKGKANNFLDLAQSGNNKFKSDMTTLELDTQQQQFLSDYISAKAQSNQLPKGVLIPNDSNFTRNSINFYATNDEFQRDVLNTAKLIKKFYTYPKFEVLPISGDMIDQAGAKARQEASKESAYIDYSDKSRTNPGSVKTTGGNGKNNGTGKNQFQKTTTKDGKKIKFINGLR